MLSGTSSQFPALAWDRSSSCERKQKKGAGECRRCSAPWRLTSSVPFLGPVRANTRYQGVGLLISTVCRAISSRPHHTSVTQLPVEATVFS